jgi:LAGLIDADG DNA endonuclease family
MQDGAKATSGGLYICTDLFEAEHTIKLSKYLTETFSLKVTTPKAPGKTGALRIYIQVFSMGHLRNLV